ncbi:pantoate--beta-alanine ligase [Candidatus Solincola tengchongensis]|uniref:pantoate--beta-alanine ligase n=1 Tax=Candidatus Solincola tengchongensis TaxID=2900693 RepID=UPI00257F0605|nr:pantoate--beta-alanine ligase [Candidatus Solincola tengchongensis]
MRIVTVPWEMTRLVTERREAGQSVGLVPTMGFFHAGHVSLMRAAREENDFVVVSLFVNPIQFGPREDFKEYPRDLQRDVEIAAQAGVDCIFHPRVEDMYPQPYLTFVEVEGITEGLCGASRPGHFRGVATVVAKLFHIIPAHRAYFGLKDAQQVRVIQKMVEDLNFDIQIVTCPTVREEDGLAMSSRNVYLKPEERRAATVLYRSLRRAEEMVRGGEREAREVLAAVREMLETEPLVEPEYVEAVDWEGLRPVERLQGKVLIALAARVGKARLIDNVLLEV